MRRRFMDMELCQIHPSYYDGLMRYHRAMDQRNMVLKRGQEELLEPFEIQMAQSAAVLTEQRDRFLQRLQEQVNILHPSLTDGLENMEVCYRPGFHGNDFVEEFQQKLTEIRRQPEQLAEMSAAARRSMQTFSIHAFAEHMESIYLSQMAHHGGGRQEVSA